MKSKHYHMWILEMLSHFMMNVVVDLKVYFSLYFWVVLKKHTTKIHGVLSSKYSSIIDNKIICFFFGRELHFFSSPGRNYSALNYI